MNKPGKNVWDKMERQPPSQYKTLDDLFAQAAHYAEWNLRDLGSMQPSIFIISADGPPAFLAYGKQFGDEQSKNDFVQAAQMFCLAHAATMSVFALETWVTARTRAERKDAPDEMPSEAFDRREVISLLGETREHGNTMRMLPIIRHDNGQFFNLGDPDLSDGGMNFAGRFANILPTKTAPAVMRQMAAMMLELKSVKVVGTAPRGKSK